jgi:hypothetical protein
MGGSANHEVIRGNVNYIRILFHGVLAHTTTERE